jgi:hypothetical protein
MEGGVRRVFKLGASKAFVVVDDAVPDELNLRDAGYSLEIRVQDRLLGAFGLVVAVAIALGVRIELLDRA